eukprot:5521740-Lingulodinium_polyedra.AAC.1
MCLVSGERQSARATSTASASHKVLKAGSPRDAPKRWRSTSWRMSENHATGSAPRYSTPPMPHGDASVTTMRRSAEEGRSRE